MDKEEMYKEEIVLKFVERFCADHLNSPEFQIPSEEDLIEELALWNPLQIWWADRQDLLEWARYARDVIIEGRNYRASKGRDLHDDFDDPAYMY